MDPDVHIRRQGAANFAFTPGAAIHDRSLFAGRMDQVMKVIDTITRPGQHAIMYGERGVGKTSLGNVLHDFLPNGDKWCTVKVNCSSGTTFSDLWKAIFRQIELSSVAKGYIPIKDELKAMMEHLVDRESATVITPNDIHFILSQMPTDVIIIIDELDRVQDKQFLAQLADTIKVLSDYSLRSTLILIGVGDSVLDLIDEHRSISRALEQIALPRMSREELGEILDSGMTTLGMTMGDDVKRDIITLSRGLPHFTHLLALEAVKNAIFHQREEVEEVDLKVALKHALEKAYASITEAYSRASSTTRGKWYQPVLIACAISETDARTFFTPAEVGRAVKKITGQALVLASFTRILREFASDKRGNLLVESGKKGSYKYRFADPMMQPFIMIDGLATGRLPRYLVSDTRFIT